MKSFLLLQLLSLGAIVVADSKVNFYYDDNCQQFAGTSNVPLSADPNDNAGATLTKVGGPFGSRSGMFIELDPQYASCLNRWGFIHGDETNVVPGGAPAPLVWSPSHSGDCVDMPDQGGIQAYVAWSGINAECQYLIGGPPGPSV